MTFIDIITHPSKSLRSSSVGNDLNKKNQLQQLKRINTSILNLFSRHRPSKNLEKSIPTKIAQQRNSFLQPPSFLTTSELSRSISNKSITFALIFDELDDTIVNEEKQATTNLDPPEDLVIVVPNKYVTDEPKPTNSNIEPYPFRSELPECLLPKSNSSTKKKFVPYHRLKKLRRPIKTIQPINKLNRSNSAPNMLSALPLTFISTTPETKPVRRWFKLPSFNRFLRSFIKHSNQGSKQHTEKSITTRKYSEMIY